MAISKVTLNGSPLMDATSATATAEQIISGYTAMIADGLMTSGTGGGGLGYDSGTFTLASDYGGGAGIMGIDHNLGEVPGLVIVWTDYYDDDSHTPDKATTIGYIAATGLLTAPQRLSSVNDAENGLVVGIRAASGERRYILDVASANSYFPAYQAPTATQFYINKRQYSTSNYWIGGITYRWIVIKRWW